MHVGQQKAYLLSYGKNGKGYILCVGRVLLPEAPTTTSPPTVIKNVTNPSPTF